MICTRCEGTGFLNLHQVDEAVLSLFDWTGNVEAILDWIKHHPDSDVQICDCCGDGYSGWHSGEPGRHSEKDFGMRGPYAYNGGLPECW